VATFGPVSVGDWVANAVSQLGMQATIDDVCYALLAADASLKMIADHSLRRHSFVVASIVGTQTIVALVSNFESFSRGQITRRGAADESLTISYIKPKSPVLYVTGPLKRSPRPHMTDLSPRFAQVFLSNGFRSSLAKATPWRARRLPLSVRAVM